MLSKTWILAALTAASMTAAFSVSDLTLSKDTISLSGTFKSAVPGYDFRPHHNRTPFAVSAGNGNTYVAYSTGDTVYVQQVDHANGFAAVGGAVAVSGLLAGGLVAHDDGFALLTTRNDGTSANAEPTAYLVRYTNGKETWATPLNGKNAADDSTMTTSSDVLDGDLTFNGSIYGAYFVVHGASGWTEGHYGDSIQYVDIDGKRQANDQYSNTWGCSHNEGIAIAPTASQPFLTLCSNDWQTGIYLNTDTRTMSGPKISNDMTTAGYAGEPFGGASGSYSNIAQFSDGSALVAWQTHGASATSDGGAGATMEVLTVTQRWNVHNVAVAPLINKSTPLTTVTLTPGSAGDDNVKFITKDATADRVNVRTAAYSDADKLALVTYETVNSPKCESLGTTCTGTYAGTTFQLVNAVTGAASGAPFSSTDTFVAGNIVKLPTGELAWPYVNVAWDLSASASTSNTAAKLSFAKLATGSGVSTPAVSSSTSPVSSSAAAVSSTSSTASASSFVLAPVSSTSEIPLSSATTTSSTAVVSPTSTEALSSTAAPETTELATSTSEVESSSSSPAETVVPTTELPTSSEAPASTEVPTSTDAPETTEVPVSTGVPSSAAAPDTTEVATSSVPASSVAASTSATPSPSASSAYPAPSVYWGWPWKGHHGRGRMHKSRLPRAD